jgi:geranylgeranyl diphosphate synthase, type I
MTQCDTDRAAGLVEVAGSRHGAQRCADERIQAAIAVLPDALRSDELLALSQLICRREP